jgi:hypothetical protein
MNRDREAGAARINRNCPCPNRGCELWGNCKQCAAEHKGKHMYCRLTGWRKRINDVLCVFLPKG